ncbi:glycoside hydrolase superfamily [Cercophora newfieldiana]|uniref:Glycoside hydrolase superfamily n=1 Tax=Cercophora newfieldiana TaxID=92897 RepID=A0AA39YEG7_9PEZI|nr:glycoside hydrolase superfamily [Cercophora newfieldiana]
MQPPANPDANLAAAAAGVTYSPYNADGTCRSAAQINSDFQRLATQQNPPYTTVRIYGVDCDQVARVLPAADAIGVKLFLGIFNLDDLSTQINTLVAAVNASSRGWAAVDTVSVGNELVNNGQATPQQVIAAMNAARTSLRSAGFAGPVVTVDTFLAVERNPALCDASDYCAINVHPFFDADTPADQAGAFVLRKVNDVRGVLRDKSQKVVVTESGWPWQGNANGKAVPGRENQRVAVRSIVDVYAAGNPGGLFLFTAFDDPWKKPEAWTFYAEQFWGMDVAQ